MGLEYQIHSILDGAGSLHNDCLALRAADELHRGRPSRIGKVSPWDEPRSLTARPGATAVCAKRPAD
jgi:hypothetical protein